MVKYYTVPDEDDEGNYVYGKLLKGPGGFECYLGEPEDCSWLRDGSPVVAELNRLREIIRLLTL
jgi:hypothetical protein